MIAWSATWPLWVLRSGSAAIVRELRLFDWGGQMAAAGALENGNEVPFADESEAGIRAFGTGELRPGFLSTARCLFCMGFVRIGAHRFSY